MTDSLGGNFIVTSDPQLGDLGPAAEMAILNNCDADFDALLEIFGGPPPGLPFNVQLTADNRGASHANCTSTQIFIGVRTADPQFARFMLVAEVVEVFSAALNNGWDCERCHGEGLSRVLAQDICQITLPRSMGTAGQWLNKGRPDYVNPPTLGPEDPDRDSDLNPKAVGCAVLFLYWLHIPLNKSWADIVAAGGSTLAKIYANLNLGNDPFPQFSAAIDQLYPDGSLFDDVPDNVFLPPALG